MDSGACVWAGASAGHAWETGWADGARVGPAGRPAGPAERTGPTRVWAARGGREKEAGRYWVGFWASGWAGFSIFPFYFLFTLSIQNLIQTKFEFKFEFESKPHSNKIMHQHECNKKFKPRENFNYLRNKIELNAILNTINLRKLNKPIKFIIN